MKQLLNSSFVILCMLGLVVLGLLNTCQLDSLEEGIIDYVKNYLLPDTRLGC